MRGHSTLGFSGKDAHWNFLSHTGPTFPAEPHVKCVSIHSDMRSVMYVCVTISALSPEDSIAAPVVNTKGVAVTPRVVDENAVRSNTHFKAHEL